MLIGRKIGQYNQKITRPGAGSLAVTSYAPDVVVSGTTLFLNHFNETDASISLSDVVAGVTWTINANAEADTAQKKFGTSSVLIPQGANEWIEADGWTSPHEQLWTWEGFVMWDVAYSSGTNWEAFLATSADVKGARLYLEGDADLWLELNGTAGSGSTGVSVATISINTWYHWAVVRESSTTYGIYWNGSRVNQSSWGSTQDLQSIDKVVYQNNTDNSTVWFDETRLITSVEYTGTYTVPSTEFSI